MRVFRIIGRSIANAGKSIVRNFSLSMASITCTIITLVLVAIGFLISYNVNNITKDIEKEMTISVFIDKSATDEELTALTDKLKKIDNVKNVIFKSKEDVKEEIQKENDDFSKLIDAFGDDENPFQDSYVIEVEDIKDINETATTIKNLDKVEKVKYGEDSVNYMVKVFDVVRKGTIILVIGLILVTTFLINNTIKITIFSRKNEIDIMRLVGTSNTVIKLPFLIEGFLIGLFGSIIPVLITIFGYTFAYNELTISSPSNFMSLVKLSAPGTIIYRISLYLALIGTMVGMIASVKAVRKYLTI
jgi:cell division transport system permease protein